MTYAKSSAGWFPRNLNPACRAFLFCNTIMPTRYIFPAFCPSRFCDPGRHANRGLFFCRITNQFVRIGNYIVRIWNYIERIWNYIVRSWRDKTISWTRLEPTKLYREHVQNQQTNREHVWNNPCLEYRGNRTCLIPVISDSAWQRNAPCCNRTWQTRETFGWVVPILLCRPGAGCAPSTPQTKTRKCGTPKPRISTRNGVAMHTF